MPCAMFFVSKNAAARWSRSPASPACGRKEIVFKPLHSRSLFNVYRLA